MININKKNTKVLLYLPRARLTSFYDVMMSCCDRWRHVTSWCHAVTPYAIIMSDCKLVFCILALKSGNHGNCVFWSGDLDLWPLTLTIELIEDIIKVNPCTKFRDPMSNGSAVRALTHGHTHTHKHTDKTVSITSTADSGGNYQR